MSITGALSNALSGLTATARGVETTSNNVANALTEGYARRELEVAARNLGSEGQGVRVVGVRRMIDMTLVGDRRLADAGTGNRDTRAAFYQGLADTLGDTGDGSLLARISSLSSSLVAAASRPESTARLQNVLDAASALARGLNQASDAVQTARQDADSSIASQVDQLNTTLARVKDLNAKITEVRSVGRDASALEDQRQTLVDSIARIVPLREVQRENGQIALFTAGGAALLDGRAAEFGFTAKPGIDATDRLADGALGGLTLNGRPVRVSGETGLMAGGSLAAAFAIRDELAPQEQVRLDALARSLVDRLASPSVDPTLGFGDAGLFTDSGGAFDPADEAGLAGRLSVNVSVDPSRGGDLWCLRDGLNATSAGPSGNATLLNAIGAALDARLSASTGGIEGAYSLAGFATETVSLVSSALLSADEEASFAAGRRDELHALELGDGVDTDQELERLLRLEQAYAANAKVITACDQLINHLLEM
ncbi:flagellar hook-associated protein FlgK [Cereibacter sphaeroides]|uniref:flagellar hook-associated protein FlgK n=1 Tax=Cereibacter sphaeroides TaxID=1063 RepID=UPI001F3CFCD9|nr:flagellar hook-associated protein FlgK [Cereibacter sphaeroides]MCE6960951.1 flagellar hook-associated protein FlgK [Cereibacter sphaeroides]MCE6969751.1 flagellar hook-associated protein FlgK [Cereibacter sphaeroides]MCE6975226.1 flagellar hook-associated protein FlgK [Cereibacter sphaeroides]